MQLTHLPSISVQPVCYFISIRYLFLTIIILSFKIFIWYVYEIDFLEHPTYTHTLYYVTFLHLPGVY